jgi:hypothetical protein
MAFMTLTSLLHWICECNGKVYAMAVHARNQNSFVTVAQLNQKMCIIQMTVSASAFVQVEMM